MGIVSLKYVYSAVAAGVGTWIGNLFGEEQQPVQIAKEEVITATEVVLRDEESFSNLQIGLAGAIAVTTLLLIFIIAICWLHRKTRRALGSEFRTRGDIIMQSIIRKRVDERIGSSTNKTV